MLRRAALVVPVVLLLALLPGTAGAQAAEAGGGPFRPGAAGIGDPYFPLDGNGGYDVRHYLLDVRYTPGTDMLAGVATITARATQNLSAFNLDLDGLTVRSITVNGRAATWSRSGDELTVTPRRGLPKGRPFVTVVRYDGVPGLNEEPGLGAGGVFHTDDGMVIIGQPHSADTWFPVNDHPIDKASYTVRLTVPAGLEAVSNGVLLRRGTQGDWSSWLWHASEPMASYLAMATVGEYDLRAYRADGIRYWDALDPDLFDPLFAPRTGEQMAISQVAASAYKRLSRVIDVPAGGAQLSFYVSRNTEPDWDYFFVEAHTVGQDDWTTLPDRNGHTSASTGESCPYIHTLHPFLAHYQTPSGETCTASGTTGTWSAATGISDGYEQWVVDLTPYAGRQVEVSLTYVTDDLVTLPGVAVDDIVVSTGSGSTSFEADGDTMDGWTVPGAPPGSAPNPNDWIAGTAAQTPPTPGEIAEDSFARQPEIIRFLSGQFGPYPFSAAGGIVDDTTAFGFALETQTRPIYSRLFFTDPVSGDSVVVHELAHQWFGDSLTIARWQHIWLNEGFATYAEWLWSEREGLGTAQEIFDNLYTGIPADSPFWSVVIGDPGPENLFDIAVYWRGAMTLHQLRLAVGDATFFRILQTWAASQAGGHVTTPEFIAHAERIAGRDLDALFTAWLFTPGRPALVEAPVVAGAADLHRTTMGGRATAVAPRR